MNWVEYPNPDKVVFFAPMGLYRSLVFKFLLTLVLCGISIIVTFVILGKHLDYYFYGATAVFIFVLFICIHFSTRYLFDLSRNHIEESFVFIYGKSVQDCYEFTSKKYEKNIFDSILLDKYYEPSGYSHVLYVRLRVHAPTGSLVLGSFPESGVEELSEAGKKLSAVTGIKYADIRRDGEQPLRLPRPYAVL